MVINGGNHLHMQGRAADHPEWAVDATEERSDFDARALEEAMVRARTSAYAELAELDAA